MLSLAAAMVLTTTSAMAFDANSTGVIVTHTDALQDGFMQEHYNPNFPTSSQLATPAGTLVKSGYVSGKPATDTLKKSDNNFGDALIYPSFRTGAGWNTEMTVANTSSKNAVVAKVVLYAASDSRELIDFNIYLSADDVFTFNIDEEGYVVTSDDSIEKSARRAEEVAAASDDDTVEMNKYRTERKITSKPLPVEQGYAVIYAMAEANASKAGDNLINHKLITAANPAGDEKYHKQHDRLFLDYRELLDTCRGSSDMNHTTGDAWRSSYISTNYMRNGMMVTDVTAPNQIDACDDGNITSRNYMNDVNFVSPTSEILFGSMTITNDATDVDTRDLLLNAVALSNYTGKANNDANGSQMLLWTAGELASIHDRNIMSDGDNTNASPDYNIANVAADAVTFEINRAWYTYDDAEMQNTLVVASPVKRPLVQLLGNASYWSNVSSTLVYGEYDYKRTIYNTREDVFIAETSENSDVITSPYNPGDEAVVKYDPNEISGLSALQSDAADELDSDGMKKFDKGYVIVDFKGTKVGETTGAYPAIVTQMTAKTVNDRPQTNWTMAPVK